MGVGATLYHAREHSSRTGHGAREEGMATTRRPIALMWLLLAAGAGVYLFGMDVLYDLEHGIWWSSGGGGWGPPSKRSAEARRRDAEQGLTSAEPRS